METEKTTLKLCPKGAKAGCGEVKRVGEFYKNKSEEDGLDSYCKSCRRKYSSENKNRPKKQTQAIDEKKLRSIKFVPRAVREPSIKELPARGETSEQSKTQALKFYKKCFLGGYESLKALGLTQRTIQLLFGCSTQGMNTHTLYDRDGDEAYQQAMAELQGRLANQVLVHALGFDYEETKTIYVREKTKKGKSIWKPSRREINKRHHSGSPELLIFYVTNRFPKQWKVSRELITKKGQTYDEDPGIRDRKKIESLARDVLKANSDTTETEHSVQDGIARISGEVEQAGEK